VSGRLDGSFSTGREKDIASKHFEANILAKKDPFWMTILRF
jgi:hypothetical protein